MTREWKPGDVARVQYDDVDQVGIVRRKVAGGALEIAYVSGGYDLIEERDRFGFARPLVVIDYEDAAQVERLAAIHAALPFDSDATDADDMQAALREFANPTPPRPEEPRLIGAIVEARIAIDGTKRGPYTFALAEDGTWVCLTDGHSGHGYCWSFLTDVRVLSEGVTP